MYTEEKIQRFCDLLTKENKERLLTEGFSAANTEYFIKHAIAHYHIGNKYARVDIGGSGRYMVELDTECIYGIKGYGVIHRGHSYGTLDTIDDYYWGRYRAVKRVKHNPNGNGKGKKAIDTVSSIIAFEQGELGEEDTIALFQHLINTGEVWSLQGFYGRTASDMIEAGLCVLGKEGHKNYWGGYVPSRYEVKKGTKGSEDYARKMTGTNKIFDNPRRPTHRSKVVGKKGKLTMAINIPQFKPFIVELERAVKLKRGEKRTLWKCSGKPSMPKATAILKRMGFDVASSKAYFNKHHAGCDCEILWNVDPSARRDKVRIFSNPKGKITHSMIAKI